MDISVLVPCLNAEETLAAQLEALANQRCDVSYEILVSDNGSTDGSKAIVEQFRIRNPKLAIRLIDSSDRRGVCRARNVAIAQAQSEFIAICDADDIVCDEWIQAMYNGLCQSPIVASVISPERVNPDWVIRAFQWKDSVLGPVLGFLPAQAGWGLGVRKSFHYEIGEFDESFFRQGDIDYSWKAQLAGAKFYVAHDAVVYYRIKSSFGKKFAYAIRDGRSTRRLYERYREHGMPVPRDLESLQSFVLTLRRTLRERDPSKRLPQVHQLGRIIGFQLQKWFGGFVPQRSAGARPASMGRPRDAAGRTLS